VSEELSPYEDLCRALRSARHPTCRLAWARRIVQARFERGDYEMLGELSVDIREAMAMKLVEEVRS